MRRGRLWLALPAAVLATLDVALTLAGQGPGSRAGDHAQAAELNPMGARLLRAHPLAFALGGAAWAFGLAAAVARLREPLAAGLAFAATLGHAVGGASWLARVGSVGLLLALADLPASRRLAVGSWRRAGWSP